MFINVIHAKYINDYKIELEFNDGRKGIADLSDSLNGPVFGILK